MISGRRDLCPNLGKGLLEGATIPSSGAVASKKWTGLDGAGRQASFVKVPTFIEFWTAWTAWTALSSYRKRGCIYGTASVRPSHALCAWVGDLADPRQVCRENVDRVRVLRM